jgi:hypothetical protein
MLNRGALRALLGVVVGAMLMIPSAAVRAEGSAPLVTWPDLPAQVTSSYGIEGSAYAFYPSGAVTALLTVIHDGQSEIVVSDKPVGGTWSDPVPLGAPSAYKPGLIVTGEGTAAAVWSESATSEVKSSNRSADGTWSTPVTVSEPGAKADGAVMAVTSDGTIVVAYNKDLISCAGDRCATYGYDVGLVERPAGGTWGATRWLTDAEGFTRVISVGIATDDTVSVLVHWSNSMIYDPVYFEGTGVLQRPAGGDWQPLKLLFKLPNSGFLYSFSGVSAGPDETVAGTYSKDNDAEPFLVSLSPDGALSTPVDLGGANGLVGQGAEVSWSADGDLTVLWTSRPDGVHATRYEAHLPALGTWSSAWDVGIDPGSGRAGSVTDADGNLTAWASGTDGAVRTRTRTSDGTWQPVQVASPSGQSWTAYDAAVSPAGQMVITYSSSTAMLVQAGIRTTEQPTPPGAPTSVLATAGNGQIRVSWGAPSSTGGAYITRYTATASPGGRTCSTTMHDLAVPAAACTITGLTNGVAYQVSVGAFNSTGQGAAAAAAATPTGPPSAPRSVVASPRTRSLVASWASPTSSGGLPITRYTATASPGGRSCSTTGSRSCTITGLINGTAYRIIVTARNSKGAGPSSVPSAAMRAGSPSQPRALLVGRPTATTTKVSWSAPAYTNAGSVRSYQVRWSSSGSTWSSWTSSTRRYVTRSGLTRGRSYWVQVRAINASGAGPAASKTFTR